MIIIKFNTNKIVRISFSSVVCVPDHLYDKKVNFSTFIQES